MNITSKQFKVAVVGLGHWGPNLIKAFLNDHRISEVIGIEVDPKRYQFISKEYPQLSLLNDLDICLKDPSIEAIVIATPTETHYALGLKCLEANKHLFIEKPLSHSYETARHLVNLAKEKQKILMTGHIFLYNQAVQKMKELVENGELGDILHIKSIRANLGPVRHDVNALWDLAAHDISIFDYIFERVPLQVSCRAFSLLGLEQQDIAVGTLEYSFNKSATFLVSWIDPVKTRQITIIGSKKMLVFDDMQPNTPLTVYDKSILVSKNQFALKSGTLNQADCVHSIELHVGDSYLLPITKTEPLKEECRDFVDCILSGSSPRSDGENGLRIISQLEALVRSYSQFGALINL